MPVQSELQPWSSKAKPSSHTSVPLIYPSPQFQVHTERGVGIEVQPHVNPTVALHLIHPGPSKVWSHVSPPFTRPSPQIGLHPYLLQLKPSSIWQLQSHPSFLTRFPSSHSSPSSTTLFPQSLEVQTPAVHVHPKAAPQRESHPWQVLSPLPKSQSSLSFTTLFPHVFANTKFGDSPVRLYPFSNLQVLEHPSLLFKFPSSHSSGGVITEFPHLMKQSCPYGQSYPASIVQVDEQPSLSAAFPSSQVSEETT